MWHWTHLTKCAESERRKLAGTGCEGGAQTRYTGRNLLALEKVFGRYKAVNHTISGVYSSESRQDPEFREGARPNGELCAK